MRNVETLVRRDRALVGVGLAGITLLAWFYLIRFASHMGGIEGMHAPSVAPMLAQWIAADFAPCFLMWVVMMVAMMIPAATPIMLVFVTVQRNNAELGLAAVPPSIFLLGYVTVWTGFSLFAALAQSALESAALVSPHTLEVAPLLGGALLIAAAAYQLTPLKHVCLSQCQSPLGFLLGEWREGWGGAFVMGLRHGIFCVGCCWVLMTILFVAGVMNLLWVAAIAAFVLLEKLIPGRLISYTASVVLTALGGWLIAGSL